MKLRFHWGAGISLVYAAFAAGTISMVAIASSAHVDLVSSDYYERSLTFDRHIAAVERGATVDLTVALESTPAGATLVLGWPRNTFAAIGSGTVTLYRPSSSGADRAVSIAVDESGRQSLPLAGLPSGKYVLQVAWTAQGLEYYTEREVVVP
jgi:nitrogen fixation protein FixH